MGSTLSFPATTKHSETGGDDRYEYAVSEMQGWRITMEDAHAIVLDLDDGQDEKNSFFAVYDGHGGASVAKFAGQNVHKRLISEESYQQKEYEVALKRAFLGTDEDLLANPAHTRDPSGCTAVAALITHDGKIYVANAGDSRSVLSVKGEVKPLSFDHKPSNDIEKARITGAGGYIEFGRVNGNLSLSRALGDFEFKKNYALGAEKQAITADPDITVHQITEEDEFLILACDGIWDCLTSQQVVDYVRLKVSQGQPLSEIGETMCEYLLAPDTSSGAGTGCDNMTIMIIALLHGRTKEEWYQWVTERVKSNYGYTTPTEIPQIYSPTRLLAFKSKREAFEAREKMRGDRASQPSLASSLTSTLSSSLSSLSSSSKSDYTYDSSDDEDQRNSGPMGFLSSAAQRVLGSTGGISFSPGSGILSDGGNLMFGGVDDSDDDSDGEYGSGLGGGVSHFGMGGLGEDGHVSMGAVEHLKGQLDEYEREGDDTPMPSVDGHAPAQSPPVPAVNGVKPKVAETATTAGPDSISGQKSNSIAQEESKGESKDVPL